MSRPRGVPEGASFSEEEKAWIIGSQKGGQPHGPHTKWNDAGKKVEELRYREGVLHGPFRRFFDNGELREEGNYRNGEINGLCTTHRNPKGDGPPPHEDVADVVVTTEVEYNMGRPLTVRHFDKKKRRVLADGTPLPEHPKGVPSVADYDGDQERWFHGQTTKDGQRTGFWMAWTKDGTLVEETEYHEGELDGVSRLYADNGTLIEEGTYVEGKRTGTWSTFDPKDGRLLTKADYDDGQYHGSVIEYGPDGRSRVRIEYDFGKKSGQYLARIGKDKYKGGRIRVENGTFKDDQPVGRWKLLNKKLEPVVTIDFGVPKTDEEELKGSPVFEDRPHTQQHWQELYDQLQGARSVGESLLAAARRYAVTDDGAALQVLFEEACAPLTDKGAQTLAEEVIAAEGGRYCSLTNALVRGARPDTILQQVAKNLDREGKSRVAYDFAKAAVLLRDQEPSLYFTRALIAINLGEQRAAEADARVLENNDADNAAFLLQLVRVLFPDFDFWPERLLIDGDEREVRCVRDAAAIGEQIRILATRFQHLRRAVLARMDSVQPWLPPDVTPLIKDGEVAVPDDAAALPDGDGMLTTLLVAVRAHWAAICWLCWAAGEHRPALPLDVRPPLDLGALCTMLEQRLAATRAMERGDEPDDAFTWERIASADMNPHIAGIARQEFEEALAHIRWLVDDNIPSPHHESARGA